MLSSLGRLLNAPNKSKKIFEGLSPSSVTYYSLDDSETLFQGFLIQFAHLQNGGFQGIYEDPHDIYQTMDSWHMLEG